MAVYIPVSLGELFDKITILRIKKERLNDDRKRENVLKELSLLEKVLAEQVPQVEGLDKLVQDLYQTNLTLWDIEDDIRSCERKRDFSEQFIELARSVYFTNDRRSKIKYQINTLLLSEIVEEKSYEPYPSS